MKEFGIFNDEASDWSSEEAVEAGFYSYKEAEQAIKERYNKDDGCIIHEIEDPEEEEED